MSIYRRHINKKFEQNLKHTHELHKWTVTHPHEFWIDLYSYLKITPPLSAGLTKAYDDTLPMSSIPKFFAGHRLNYAENVLSHKDPSATALIAIREGQSLDGSKWTWAGLTDRVRQLRSALLRSGVKEGDRVAAWMSNNPWTIAIFLATASMGGIFTCVSTDMGVSGVVNRLQQVTPTMLFVDGDAVYKGKTRSMGEKIDAVLKELHSKPSTFVVRTSPRVTTSYPTLDDFLARSSKGDRLAFPHYPFTQPLTILYSSGTTGPPKCIVHSHGIILQLLKISTLSNSLSPQSVVMQYSSTSWVLWNIMNGHLAAGATTICYDGSPLWPDAGQLLRICERHGATYLGTSPRYLLELQQARVVPKRDFDLSRLEMVTTTGATLTADQYHWFYGEAGFPKDKYLSSVAGGTDIVTSWFASDPAGPVYEGEMQAPALGQDVDIADPETAESIAESGEFGELVCRSPFPSMPIYFWGDKDGSIYKSSYFEKFEGKGKLGDVWTQHDWIRMNPTTRGIVMTGRSDGVLNPSGIRFGSAEIYSVVEGPEFNTTISDTLCVGRKRPSDRDEDVFLFVKMRSGHSFDQQLVDGIRNAIRQALSSRHVPKFIEEVREIPVTINGKKVEILVKQIVSGKRDIKVSSTVSNPECLEEYRKFEGLEAKRQSKL